MSHSESDGEVWHENEDPEDPHFKDDNCPPDSPIDDQASLVSKALSVRLLQFLLCVQAIYHISDNALKFFVKFF